MKSLAYSVWKITPKIIKKIIIRLITYKYFPNVRIGANCKLQLSSILNKNITLGTGSFIWDNCSFFTLKKAKISIWNYCSIAQDSFFITYNHATEYLSMNHIPGLELAERRDEKSIYIWHNVWIGTKSVILPWVNIWSWAIIWAGSIVTKDVKAYSVVWGVPAKHIKNRFPQEVADAIESLKWYNWPLEKIKTHSYLFTQKLTDENINFIKEK